MACRAGPGGSGIWEGGHIWLDLEPGKGRRKRRRKKRVQPQCPQHSPAPKSNFKKTLSPNTFRPKLRHPNPQQPVTPESPQLSSPLPGGESIIRTSFWALFGVSKDESWIKDRDGIVFPVMFLARRC